jgi:hypothetical protein
VFVLGVALACASVGCAERRPPPRPPLREVCAPVPPCPTWVEAFKANRPPLHVHVYDGVSNTAACTKGKSVRVTVYLDEQSVGLVDVPCLDEPQATPPSYRVDGEGVAPGLHELRIDVQTPRGVVQGSTLLSLPAFDLPPDGNAIVFGSEIAVGVGPDDLAIGPPQVYAPKAL